MRKITIISVLTILLLFAFTLTFLNVYTIIDGDSIHHVILTKNSSLNQAIQKAGILIKDGDVISSEYKKLNINVIKIKRAKPVQLCIDGKCIELETTQQTVGEALKDAQIKVGEKDKISPQPNSPVYAGEKIEVLTYKTLIKTVKIPIPHKVIYEQNKSLQKGKVIKFRNGEDGILEKKFSIAYFGGKKVSQSLVSEKVAKPAISTVYMIGEAKYPTHYLKKMKVVATAYSPRVIETDGNPWRTATGMRSAFGIVAVDPKVIPLGTLMYVEGYGYAVAGDTGSAIKGNRIDVFFYSTNDAFKWGRKTVTIYILPGKWNFPEKLNY